jgi:hypothetical protein
MSKRRLTPMATDYDTVGAFYASLSENLAAFVVMRIQWQSW